MNQDSSKQGKVARLPERIRHEICVRIFDGQGAPKILPWLNALPEVKKILDEDYEGLRVSDQNLSVWRKTGYQEWLRRRERIDRTRELARYAAEQTKAGGASIAEGAQAIASGKLLELLETLDEVIEQKLDESEDGDKGKLSAEALVMVANALGSLRTSEQNDVRLAQNEKKLKQKDEELSLAREKFMRDTAELFLKWHVDKSAADIAAGTMSNADKIEHLGQLMFGETWKQAKPAPNK
jgi:hypothetical protein